MIRLLPLLMLSVLIAFMARGELVLTNYTAAHPLKILCSGDSITDDSVTNGAWRAYLEKLLVANGYPFTNLGRWTSTPTNGFTQVHHEGMDGAVIAAPGLSGPTHGYAATNNYALLSLADALTNLTPDLVLIDLGVNDMGRGRNPFVVATNNYPALLNLIFSNVPNAHVIISKPTSITYATLLSPPYNTYRTNMPAFGEAVQGLAIARRARGQNVFVADLFSAVYGKAALNTDGTHPNATGLSDLANEMMFRIASITARPDSLLTPLILGGSVWKYFDQGLDLGTNWSQPRFDDSSWSQGGGRFGYGVFGLTTPVSYGQTSTNKYITTYFRNAFVVPDTAVYTNLTLRLDRADGAVVWLNGRELFRANLPAGSINFQTQASAQVGLIALDDINTYFSTNLPVTSLQTGTNVIAVEIHKYNATVATLTFDLELFGNGIYPPTLSIATGSSAMQLAWPANYTNFVLQSANGFLPAGTWQLIPGPYPLSNSSFQVSVPTVSGSNQFFRLMQSGQ